MATIQIGTDGQMKFIWSDKLAPLFNDGRGTIRRASHVEPTAAGKWTADMAPVNGPVLGPYDTRGEALAAETKWIEENVLNGKTL